MNTYMLFTYSSFVSKFPVFIASVPKSLFHSTHSLWLNTKHRLFSKVDWDRVEAGNYAVVDPLIADRILYLSEQDYIIMARVSITNNRTLKVLAAPEDEPPEESAAATASSSSTSSQNSPSDHPFISKMIKDARSNSEKSKILKLFHSPFLDWRSKTDGEWDSMVEVSKGNLRRLLSRWHDIVSWWSRGKLVSTVVTTERSTFSARCLDLYSHNGVTYLIEYLKGCLFIVNSFLGGKRLTIKESPAKVSIKITNGLPSILPLHVRHGIRTHNIHFIHTWTSVLNSYKALKGSWPCVSESLKTIIMAHPSLNYNQYFIGLGLFTAVFWKMIRSLGASLEPDLTVKELFCSSKAGPNHPNVVLGAGRDAFIWHNPDPLTGISSNYIKEWFLLTGDKRLRQLFFKTAKRYEIVTNTLQFVASSIIPTKTYSYEQQFNQYASLIGGYDRRAGKASWDEGVSLTRLLGRLHALFEPAGKVRVVAIVDYWTHCALKPLHDWMFSILKKLPTDATFDQEGALRRFSEKRHRVVWSVDLSSATDLIPLLLYRALFVPILGNQITDLWLKILVGRNFLVPSEVRENGLKGPVTPSDFVRYGTGQPMGALSSWSAMAMVHHFLVQFCAFVEQKELELPRNPARYVSMLSDKIYLHSVMHTASWFMDYLILGDDLVIADEKVALRYIAVCSSLGIKVNLKKSYVSESGFFNFANQSYMGTVNVSPLSLKEFVGVSSLAQRVEMALRATRRGWADLSGTKWVAPFVKLCVRPRFWTVIRDDLSRGLTHPIVAWILSVLLVPGSSRVASSLLPRVSINMFLAGFLRRALIWTKPLESTHSLINEWHHWESIVKILSSAVDRVYLEFLEAREQLEGFQSWSEMTLSPEGAALTKIILHDQVKTDLTRWTELYRRELKKLQIILKLPDVQPHMIEIGTGKTLQELVITLYEASESIPHIPKYLTMDFTAFEDTVSLDRVRDAERFARILTIFSGFEDLHSYTTPGLSSHRPSAQPKSVKKQPFPGEETPST